MGRRSQELLLWNSLFLNGMRNKAEIRAFAVEQVVKMKFVDECNASKIVEEAKVLEEYIAGGANIPDAWMTYRA